MTVSTVVKKLIHLRRGRKDPRPGFVVRRHDNYWLASFDPVLMHDAWFPYTFAKQLVRWVRRKTLREEQTSQRHAHNGES